MNEQIKDGGPAFPQPVAGCVDGSVYEARQVAQDAGGMSIRDWFAGMALQGIVASACERAEKEWDAELGAAYSYQIADAMLAERSKALKTT